MAHKAGVGQDYALAGLSDAADVSQADVAPYPSADPRGYGDGVVDLRDVVRLLRHATGTETHWP